MIWDKSMTGYFLFFFDVNLIMKNSVAAKLLEDFVDLNFADDHK